MSMRCSLLCWLVVLISSSAVHAQATLKDSAGDALPPGALARLGVTRFRHGGWHGGLTISTDCKTLVTTSEQGQVIRFWDIATGKLLHELRDDGRRFPSVAYAPDGKSFVTTAIAADFKRKDKEAAELIFWAPDGKKRQRTVTLEKEPPNGLLFTPDGKFLLGDVAGQVVVVEAETGKELLRYRLADGEMAAMALTATGWSRRANLRVGARSPGRHVGAARV